MSLLMQALKKAEHAKQKQSDSPSTSVAEDTNPLTIQNDEMALSPQVAEQPSSPVVNLDTLGMELSPVVEKSEPNYSEAARSEPAYTPAEPVTGFAEPEPATSGFSSTYSPQTRQNDTTEDARFESGRRANTEAMSQQLTAKIRLEQQKAAALEAGKLQAEQQKAKAVFASKQPKTNRRTLWIAAVGLLTVILFFGGGYYYLQMAPQNSTMLVKTLPTQATPAPVTPPEAAPGKEAQAEAAPVTAPAHSERQATSTALTASTSKSNNEQASLKRKTAPENGAEAIEIRQTTVDSQINPALSKGYQFFMNGDLTAAQQQYQLVLQQEPNNRDALLGMAAISINRKQAAQAGSYYLKLVELDPSDPDAIAGITSLQGGDPYEIESRLKKVLIHNPQAGAILFALGNLYAQQSRWSDAQQAYFRAYGATPANPDYAFNLAISLDRLNQEKLALEFYQRALTLSQSKPGNFNKVAVQDRVKQLQSNLETR